MQTSRVVTALCFAGGLIAVSAMSSHAQHSSGGTSPSVTEGQQGQTGSKTQGVPGSGFNPDDRASGSQPSGGSGSGAGKGSGTGAGSTSSGTPGADDGHKGAGDHKDSRDRTGSSGGHMGSGSGGSGSGR